MSFEALGLRPEILQALEELGYNEPTPIQEQAIPKVLAGSDLMACAQTGTGKTAAFSLPILHRLAGGERAPLRALVLVPTRELAIQVAKNINSYSAHLDFECTCAYGGVPIEPQEMMLRHGVDILVATPGRLIDHMWRGNIDYRHTEALVLDEADRMLDMGFIKDVLEIVNEIPENRQSLLFSATLGGEIGRLSKKILKNPERVEVAPSASTVDQVEQMIIPISRGDKADRLERLIRDHRMERSIVFTKTKMGASKLANHLRSRGIRARAIHSNRTQEERVRTLEAFRAGDVHVLVATDIAARGIDVDEITHVVNYDVPYAAEDYVHRIGRTARAGRSGVAITLVTPEERRGIKAIERLIGFSLPLEGESANGRPSSNGAGFDDDDYESGDRGSRSRRRRRGGSDRPRGSRSERGGRNERGGRDERGGRGDGSGRRRQGRRRDEDSSRSVDSASDSRRRSRRDSDGSDSGRKRSDRRRKRDDAGSRGSDSRPSRDSRRNDRTDSKPKKSILRRLADKIRGK